MLDYLPVSMQSLVKQTFDVVSTKKKIDNY